VVPSAATPARDEGIAGHSPESLKLVSVQTDVSAVTRGARMAGALALLDRAVATEGSGVYVLPEYALSPLPNDGDAIAAQAETVPGPMTERFSELSRRRGIWVAVGLLETAPDPRRPYNCIALLGPHGELHRYRKTHLWDAGIDPWRECRAFTPGQSLGRFELDGWNVGIMVCADGMFPEVPRVLSLTGAELILYPNSRPAVGPEAEATALTNVVAMVVSNPLGHNGFENVGGTSRIIDPFGRTVAVPGNREGWVAQVFRRADLRSWRAAACSIRPSLRRPDLYGPLLSGAPASDVRR
jgi:5-aminopentanamidase